MTAPTTKSRNSGVSPRPAARRRAAGRGAALTRFDGQYYGRPSVSLLAGIDEAGRGALAGPVCVGAVVLRRDCGLPAVDDSKVLSVARREALYGEVWRCASAAAVGWASAEEVDRLNVLQATFLAARRALAALDARPDYVLTDALKPEGIAADANSQGIEAIIDGDARSRAIAAASILAKVTRDRWMQLYDAEYPGYGLAAHKGYGAAGHLEAIARQGPTTLHRHSFRGVDFFDCEYRTSRTLAAMLEELREGRPRYTDPADVWRARGWMLPEAEERIFMEAWRKAPEK